VSQLADWGNFYVIVGSAAGGLTGLMFVVIALGAQVTTISAGPGLRGFVTPTVVHFCAVLLVAAIVSTPGQRPATLGLALGLCGAAGILYVGWAMGAASRQKEYEPVGEDWLFHAAMPVAAYGAIAVTALMLFIGQGQAALYVLAGATLLLLFTGIHNAWDAAVWVATSTVRRQSQSGQGKAPPPPE
jgi:hypothetical protein